jgi:hypothetical protein
MFRVRSHLLSGLLSGLAVFLVLCAPVAPSQAEPHRGHAGGVARSGGGAPHISAPRTAHISRPVHVPGPRIVRTPRIVSPVVHARPSRVVRPSRHVDHPVRRGHRGRRYIWGDGFEFWFYDGYYHGNCAWLKEQALETGSAYWWRRYRLCRALDD